MVFPGRRSFTNIIVSCMLASLLQASRLGAVHAVAAGCADPPLLGETIANHKEVFQPPANHSTQPSWLATITAWRSSCRSQIHYSDAIYSVPQLKWARTNFVQPQSHPFDRFFFNETTQRYSVSTFLGDLAARYGGIDSVLLWPSYPLLGLDDRSQYEIFEALPGGLDQLQGMVAEMHRHGVRVLFPWNGWDQFTRPDALGRPDALRWASLLNATNADGANADSAKGGDTQNDGVVHVTEDFYTNTVANGKPAAWQCEGGPSPEDPVSLNWQVMDIGYWGGMVGGYTGGGGGSWSFAPAVDKWKWVDTRRITVISDRYGMNKTDILQHAYFNAVGYESWENIWGSWNGIVPADGEALRRSAHILRFFGRLRFTQSPDWEPHTIEVIQSGAVFASKWPVGNETLWTIVNRGARDVAGPQLRLSDAAGDSTLTYFDCYHGKQLSPTRIDSVDAPGIELSFLIEGLGVGCVFATSQPFNANLSSFLSQMAAMTATPMASFDKTWKALPQTIDPVEKITHASDQNAGMVFVKGGPYEFKSSGVEIEGGVCKNGKCGNQAQQLADVQFPWEDSPVKVHARNLTMADYFMDQFPVTGRDYAKYLAASDYVPADNHNWLKNWAWSGKKTPTLPIALERVPVTYVSFREAGSYCKAQGKRLPSTIEWQYAGQGATGQDFPWGDADDSGCRPELHDNRTIPGALPVETYSANCSSVFNVRDLIGNVWQLTSSFTDAHTRRVVLKGGSNYKPTYKPGTPAFNLNKADFYYPQARSLALHNTAFLMSDSFERAGTVGFRCVRDVAE